MCNTCSISVIKQLISNCQKNIHCKHFNSSLSLLFRLWLEMAETWQTSCLQRRIALFARAESSFLQPCKNLITTIYDAEKGRVPKKEEQNVFGLSTSSQSFYTWKDSQWLLRLISGNQSQSLKIQILSLFYFHLFEQGFSTYTLTQRIICTAQQRSPVSFSSERTGI